MKGLTHQQSRQRLQQLVEEFDGRNHKELAQKYGYDINHVRRMLHKAGKDFIKDDSADLRRKQLIADFDGENEKELAQKYGISRVYVRQILRRAGFPHKQAGRKKGDVANNVKAARNIQIVDQFKDGRLLKDIAKDFGITKARVQQITRKEGLQRKPRLNNEDN